MARLNEEQIMGIKEHMCSDEKKLASLYRAKKKSWLSLKPWGIALKFLFLHHENILFPND